MTDWFDLAAQRTLKSLLQHYSSKTSILHCSAFFMVQLSHPYMTTGKTIALTRWTFVGKVMSLLFNTLSRFVIAFLPRSKHLLLSWLQSPSAVILEPKKIVSHCFHYRHLVHKLLHSLWWYLAPPRVSPPPLSMVSVPCPHWPTWSLSSLWVLSPSPPVLHVSKPVLTSLRRHPPWIQAAVALGWGGAPRWAPGTYGTLEDAIDSRTTVLWPRNATHFAPA